MTDAKVAGETKESLLVAVYDNETGAQRAVEKLSEKGFAMDMLSVLGRVHPSGDDVLGIYYTSMGSRMEAWAKQGALWGALWGMLTGAAAMFVLPGVGPVLAAGPIVEAVISALGGSVVGAAVGSAVGGAAMTGAAAATHLASVMHRMGIPKEQLDHLHQAIEEGHHVLLLREASSELPPWKAILDWSGAREILELPYTGVKDAI
jgi:Heat induced stress protein YflT domain